MSVSFYDLMKYARTGIASPDMTGFDKLRARAAFGGYPVSTITGVPPISFKADGTPLTAWSIAGNMVQIGTPTPDAPIMPEECGDKTANLFDEKYAGLVIGSTVIYQPIYVGAGTFTLASTVPQFGGAGQLFLISGNVSSGATTGTNDVYKGRVRTATAENGYVTIGYRHYNASAPDVSEYNTMLNLGRTALPYEPYGWKIPITCAGQTTPIYLDEPLRRIGDYADEVSSDGVVTRRIGVIEVNGSNIGGFEIVSGLTSIAKMRLTDIQTSDLQYSFLCSHFAVRRAGEPWTAGLVYNSYSAYYNLHFGLPLDIEDISAAREWFNAKYAASTPVCVWYVLATPTTETITAPTLTTAKGSNTLTVDTDLQPSAVSVTGNIKPS